MSDRDFNVLRKTRRWMLVLVAIESIPAGCAVLAGFVSAGILWRQCSTQSNESPLDDDLGGDVSSLGLDLLHVASLAALPIGIACVVRLIKLWSAASAIKVAVGTKSTIDLEIAIARHGSFWKYSALVPIALASLYLSVLFALLLWLSR